MESSEELRARLLKRASLPTEAPEPVIESLPDTARFVKIRRKSSLGLSSDLQEEQVSQEALVDEEGVIGLAG